MYFAIHPSHRPADGQGSHAGTPNWPDRQTDPWWRSKWAGWPHTLSFCLFLSPFTRYLCTPLRSSTHDVRTSYVLMPVLHLAFSFLVIALPLLAAPIHWSLFIFSSNLLPPFLFAVAYSSLCDLGRDRLLGRSLKLPTTRYNTSKSLEATLSTDTLTRAAPSRTYQNRWPAAVEAGQAATGLNSRL
ncbi:hypothetical protein LX36DRAFT_401882 [Colletotrichum falcatum]|nr:hypothetical protein LX36DRAFT_401882 [Colletotrichum falcatum]